MSPAQNRNSLVLLTRSIRRKLASGLVLIAGLIAVSTLCSLLGLQSYKRMVHDLELSIRTLPRQADLIATMSLLYTPLDRTIREDQPAAAQERFSRELQEVFDARFQQVRKRLQSFQQAWHELPPSLSHHDRELPPYSMLFRTIDHEMQRIEERISSLSDPQLRSAQVSEIRKKISQVILAAENMPDPANRLGERLQEAREDYSLQVRIVIGLGTVSLLVLVGLMFWSYHLIFVPIQQLHQGVRRIATGDYDYRLKINTKCEIAELADTFNEMAMRIQEDHEQKQREIEERSKQLVLSERLAGAGFLASGVAHEINNPLAAIMTAAYGLEMRLDSETLSHLEPTDREDVHEYLSLIQSEAERCERITKKLLDFSYGKGEEKNLYDVTAIVQEVISMLGHLSRYQDRKLSVNRTSPLHAWMNAPEIKQVILNLVANGLDATTAGGHVDVSLRECPDAVEITVTDDGCGMTQEQLDHIFEPFFTTKEVGKGTGLGLSITHRIVRDHNGRLEVSSGGPGQGASFCLRLPKRAAVTKAA